MEIAFLANALFIIGLHAITRDGMILGFVENTLISNWEYKRFMKDFKIPKPGERIDAVMNQKKPIKMYWLFKPLTECPTCMSSVWGTTGFLFTSLEWQWLPVWIICMAGFINLLTSIAWRE